MGQNAGNFNLSFQQVLETNQLVRSGGRFDPVRRVLRTAPVDQYEHLMANPNANVQRVWDFRLDAQGRINPELSSGFSMFTDEGSFPRGFDIRRNRLWRLVDVIDGEALMYPIELTRHMTNQNHFVIKPAVPVNPQIFRQMLRCLPWLKMY
ncbi:PREDICTED: uncharacterized protein LOC107330225 [Acropora digitifera]|uniref:uncharacterized protein LOC107330225 n=1 Tax=Acropora digitifera TaxID=70779 RepID=UPI00077A077D|nr:PREDICTED: uncharacterized protein LOC107330225 [Acropora digitifera]XP_015750347.1 PREDICTED: uncharacterized protein LOC107330225 [Acropora digitifera]XP_015750348.1 PREDICTED: uncharacterized protein LOC107330225 [Acropora digitifera]